MNVICIRATGGIKSKKNFNDLIENRSCNLPTFSAVPHPSAQLRTPEVKELMYFMDTESDKLQDVVV